MNRTTTALTRAACAALGRTRPTTHRVRVPAAATPSPAPGRSRAPGRVPVSAAVAVFASLAAAAFALVAAFPAVASDHHAHWHYMVGGRASAARNFCKQLHHEAATPGAFSLELARVNAVDIERLAREIGEWVVTIGAVSSADERQTIESQLATMATEAAKLAELATELRTWTEDAMADDAKAKGTKAEGATTDDAGLRTRVAERTRLLFHGFGRVLAAHKAAEEALDIPVPADPAPLD